MEDLSYNFEARHIGPQPQEIASMLEAVGYKSLSDFTAAVVPSSIRMAAPLVLSDFAQAASEDEMLARLRSIAAQNKVYRSYIGMGYYGTITPSVILRNILENPGWYTQYTPYQPEISQGRLEALLNYQTMVGDLTGLPIVNASLLDEGTAAAEAMTLSQAIKSKAGEQLTRYFVADNCHPQTIAVIKTRAQALGIQVDVGAVATTNFAKGTFGALFQYPGTHGEIGDLPAIVAAAHKAGLCVTVATDLLALALLTPPGEFGADIAVGSAQRFGVPLGFGGPHAAFFATRDEHKRIIPGRIVGVSRDATGRPAYRLSLQTREQHIRREKATSNICTAQVLLAVMAGMYSVYHGPQGIKRIAKRVHTLTSALASGLKSRGFKLKYESFFDTVCVEVKEPQRSEIIRRSSAARVNLRIDDVATLGISLDETVTSAEVAELLSLFGSPANLDEVEQGCKVSIHATQLRKSEYLSHPVFNKFHSETEFLRYVRRLESRDLSLGTAMIPLGSCTMKLNATSEMLALSWPEINSIHPFVPADQASGYTKLCGELERALAEITGFAATSLQPNAGAQGEYTGLLVIKAYLNSRGESKRDVCLIPTSAHGTNPASAVMAGLKVVVVDCDGQGNVDLADLKNKVAQHKDVLACLMITYPSTHGVFEASVKEIASVVHAAGGQVYLDGANLNALVGLCRPADLGADVCHINLHKTFCIPHGGGGPGMGPIGVAKHLAPFLPGHPVTGHGGAQAIGPVSAAPYGSASILTISWAYIAMMAGEGLTRATQVAILNANYIAKKLSAKYPLLYRGQNGLVAHECILDCRAFKDSAKVEVSDIARRLMDYGFHAPTVSWPVAGTIMVEPTESESKAELDRFCEALLQIRAEIAEIESGKQPPADNVVVNSPHTGAMIASSEWSKSYSREQAAFPTAAQREYKFWPASAKIDAGYGDRNFVCACPPLTEY